jgi:hypothetical protein
MNRVYIVFLGVSLGFSALWQPNAGPQLRPKAGATLERTLEGVGCRPMIMYEAPSPAYPLVCYSGKWSRGEEENACHAPPSCPYGESRQRFPCAAPHPSLALTGERHSFSHPFA